MALRHLMRVGSAAAVGLFALTAAGACYEKFCRSRVQAEYPPPGMLVDIGGRRIQMDCRGIGQPTVVFESGFGAGGSTIWAKVQEQTSKVSRTCSYSRAGILWSDPGPAPRDGDAVSADLHAALIRAGERPPYILVGHSFGALYSVLFTRRYPTEVAGLVFVDGSHPDQDRAFEQIGFPDPPVTTTQWLISKLSWTGVGRLRSGALLTMPAPPPEAPKRLHEIYTYLPTSSAAATDELIGFDTVWSEAAEHHDLGSKPLYVLTSAKPASDEERRALNATTDMARQHQRVWEQLHRDEATWSTVSRHELLPDAGHCIQCDRPDAVAAAVQWVMDRSVR
jgi:pimeloyl-ACP methyl ester carboxylesterase